MASTSLLSRFRALRQAIAALDPTADLAHLARLCARLKARAVPRRQKHLRLVDPAEIVDKALAYYASLIASVGPVPTRGCTRARDALMLAFLTHRPVRLASFAGLRIGDSVLRTPTGMRLSLGSSETKEKRPYDCACPEDLLAHLDHYLEVIRPRLLREGTSDALWIAMGGTPMSESTIYYQITSITRRLLGHPINPHLIRDCVLTSLAIDAPMSVRAGARLLGHRDLKTGEMHYNHASAASAQRAHFTVVQDLRAPLLAGAKDKDA
nr:tyrosine-type recombinase/integrase [Limobrevibacterium gyesilva]